jgi:hypothetical protein
LILPHVQKEDGVKPPLHRRFGRGLWLPASLWSRANEIQDDRGRAGGVARPVSTRKGWLRLWRTAFGRHVR